MVRILLELPNFLFSTVPLLTSTAIFAMLAVWLAPSIRRYPGRYYAAFSIPFALVAIPAILRWCGVALPVNLTAIPVLGQILRDYIHMGTLGHPLLVVVMYMGALDTRREWVRRLMSVRKELSIISGFPVLTHTLIRVAGSFPASLRYFTDHDAFIASGNVASDLGAGISSTALVLGILLGVLFILLWVTSFDGIHRRMGTVRWKKLQRWAYLFYAVMFIHAMGIQVGGVMNPREDGGSSRPAAEQSVRSIPAPARDGGSVPPTVGQMAGSHGERRGERAADAPAANVGERENRSAQPDQPATQRARRGARGFADFKVDSSAKRWIHVAELLLIYGSYLCLRLRKAGGGRN